MAEYTASVSETLRCFGVAPTNKWGDYAWNAFLWGEGNAEIPVYVFVGVDESQGSSADVDAAPFIVVSESQATVSALEHVYVLDENGYYHVFPDRSTDGEGQDFPTWTSGVASSATWTAVAASAPVWS